MSNEKFINSDITEWDKYKLPFSDYKDDLFDDRWYYKIENGSLYKYQTLNKNGKDIEKRTLISIIPFIIVKKIVYDYNDPSYNTRLYVIRYAGCRHDDKQYEFTCTLQELMIRSKFERMIVKRGMLNFTKCIGTMLKYVLDYITFDKKDNFIETTYYKQAPIYINILKSVKFVTKDLGKTEISIRELETITGYTKDEIEESTKKLIDEGHIIKNQNGNFY